MPLVHILALGKISTIARWSLGSAGGGNRWILASQWPELVGEEARKELGLTRARVVAGNRVWAA
jgi:hypothetical protein